MPTRYQPTRITRIDIDPGQRECARRYDLIAPLVAAYTRTVTVLDLGAAQGYFGIRLAEQFPFASVVMIDDGDDLLPILTANALENTIGCKRRLTEADLENLADCEHLDVVLALNLLHHLPDPGRALRAVLRMGETIIIEVPGPADVGACGDSHGWLEQQVIDAGGEPIGTCPSHTTPGVDRTLYVVRRQKSTLRAPYIGAAAKGAPPMRLHQIISRPDAKVFNMPEKGEARGWFPGINLQTYLAMGGTYPPREEVAQLVEREVTRALWAGTDIGFTEIRHKDVRPWNLVISGRYVTLIDWNDERQSDAEDDRAGLAMTLEAIRGAA